MATQTLYHISHVSNEHSDWMRACEFYIQEIQILENRLSEVSQRYTRDDVKADVETRLFHGKKLRVPKVPIVS